MNTLLPISRREFLATAAASTLALTGASFAADKKAVKRNHPIIAFSKPFAELNPDDTADLVAEIGWDGIECPIRAKSTHIQPERAEEDLPKMVEALKKRGKKIYIVTTDITKPGPDAEKLLRTVAKLGIQKYRFGFDKYPKTEHPAKKLAEVGAALKDLAALNKELGLQGGWQNHSGADYVGGPVWDVWSVIRDLDKKHIGMCFDIGHATLEGGLSWPIQTRLMEPHFVAIFLKDFYWEKGAKGWAPRWCNFGSGTVHRSFFDWLRGNSYAGPLCQHHEYKELGKDAEMRANFKKDLATLREWLV